MPPTTPDSQPQPSHMLTISFPITPPSQTAESRVVRMGGCCSALRPKLRHGGSDTSDRCIANGVNDAPPASGAGAAGSRGGALPVQARHEAPNAQQQLADCVPGCPFCSIVHGHRDKEKVVHQARNCTSTAACRVVLQAVVLPARKALAQPAAKPAFNLAEDLASFTVAGALQESHF